MEPTRPENYRNIFDSNPEPIVITRVSDGRIILVNREFMRDTGFTQDESLGRTAVELNLWPDPAERDRCFEAIQKHGELRNLPMTFRMRDGSEFPYLMSAAPVWFNDEPCIMTVARNITEMRKIEAELIAARNSAEAASLAKSEFLSSMSHEIRTPMNAILGMAELLAETDLDQQQQKFVRLMHDNGNALLALINDVLDLARVERGLLQLEAIPLDLEAIVIAVLDTLRVRATEKRLKLHMRIGRDVPLKRLGDPLRIRQILVNLVGNAIKFTDQGEVVVTVSNDADAPDLVHFSVADTGAGIPADKIEQIFSSFTQADSSTARRHGGSGLGLAIVTRLVELMDGRVWVESQVGLGSTFHFVVRLADRLEIERSAPDREESVREMPATAKSTVAVADSSIPLSILIIDDSVDNRFLLKAYFKRLPYELAEAENGLQAVEMATARRYDVLLMDVQMPVMDGLAATRKIRQWESARGEPPVPIIALTASALQENIAECLAAGCNLHVSKPISKRSLIEAIGRVMASAPVSVVDVAEAIAK